MRIAYVMINEFMQSSVHALAFKLPRTSIKMLHQNACVPLGEKPIHQPPSTMNLPRGQYLNLTQTGCLTAKFDLHWLHVRLQIDRRHQSTSFLQCQGTRVNGLFQWWLVGMIHHTSGWSIGSRKGDGLAQVTQLLMLLRFFIFRFRVQWWSCTGQSGASTFFRHRGNGILWNWMWHMWHMWHQAEPCALWGGRRRHRNCQVHIEVIEARQRCLTNLAEYRLQVECCLTLETWQVIHILIVPLLISVWPNMHRRHRILRIGINFCDLFPVDSWKTLAIHALWFHPRDVVLGFWAAQLCGGHRFNVKLVATIKNEHLRSLSSLSAHNFYLS